MDSIEKNNIDVSAENISAEASENPFDGIRFYIIDKWRFIFMILACISIVNLPTSYGKLVQIVSGFAVPCFFILSGFLVFANEEIISERILRTMKRSAICFAALVVCYFALNFAVFPKETLATISTKRFWFDFIALNEWHLEMGTTIWYVQSLLYAYIILYFLDKWDLLRFDWLIVIVCILITLFTGEFAGIIGFNFFGHNYISGNFITRAIPYLLIGRLIAKHGPFPSIIAIIAGVVLIFAEIFVLQHFNALVYSGHLIGKALIAISASIFVVADGIAFSPGFYSEFFVYGTKFLYFVLQPVYVLLNLLFDEQGINDFTGVITILICVATFSVFYFIYRTIMLLTELFNTRI